MAGAVLLMLAQVACSAPLTSRDPFPTAARSYVLVRDGQLLWQHEPEAPLPVASLAKLLTALVVVDAQVVDGRWLTTSAHAAAAAPTRLGLRTAEQLRASSALAALLIHSANDACRVLVESVSHDDAEFADAMNRKAVRLGMTHSRFVDPCGFDAPNQYSTANDLLRLVDAAMRNTLLRTLVAQPSAVITTRAGRRISLHSTNALIGRLPGTVGIKTGFTRMAGPCLLARVIRDQHEVILVMLGSDDRWWRAHAMIDAAFAVDVR